MSLVVKALAIWGAGDSVWLALDPAGYCRFWHRILGRGGIPARLAAVTQMGLSIYLLTRCR
jgi:hypothetical protein